MSGIRYIENEGALFRGYARGWPEEVYSFRQRKWLPYEGPVPKGVEWGEFISDEEAEAMIASEHERDLHRSDHPDLMDDQDCRPLPAGPPTILADEAELPDYLRPIGGLEA